MIMTTIEFNKLTNELDILAQSTMNHKGPEYTNGSDDVLANFKATAAKAGVDPLTVWLIFFDKQCSSVAAHVKNPDLTEAEPIESRFADIINYAKLGYALFKEQ
jgi:hypothetical protein|tara:strand:- start:1109 stop:1420 length:312 start_codon:yes stop_codon:yes gene_type:complete